MNPSGPRECRSPGWHQEPSCYDTLPTSLLQHPAHPSPPHHAPFPHLQAADQFKLFTGKDAPVELMRTVVLNSLAK